MRLQRLGLLVILGVAGGGLSAACLESAGGVSIWSPDRYRGECTIVISDRGPGKGFGFSYDVALLWESQSYYQTATDGTVRKIQQFKLELPGSELATRESGWRTPFNDLFFYHPIRRRPFTKWKPDGRLWQQITVATDGADGYLIILEERFYTETEATP